MSLTLLYNLLSTNLAGHACCVHWPYGYACTSNYIYKYELTSGTYVVGTQVETDESGNYGIGVCTDGTYVWVSTNGGKLKKYASSDLTYVVSGTAAGDGRDLLYQTYNNVICCAIGNNGLQYIGTGCTVLANLPAATGYVALGVAQSGPDTIIAAYLSSSVNLRVYSYSTAGGPVYIASTTTEAADIYGYADVCVGMGADVFTPYPAKFQYTGGAITCVAKASTFPTAETSDVSYHGTGVRYYGGKLYVARQGYYFGPQIVSGHVSVYNSSMGYIDKLQYTISEPYDIDGHDKYFLTSGHYIATSGVGNKVLTTDQYRPMQVAVNMTF